MSDPVKTKREKIAWMIAQQRKFIEYEHAHGITGQDFFAPDESEVGRFIATYRQDYEPTAAAVADMAHDIKQSQR